jgi:hypothetical protein
MTQFFYMTAVDERERERILGVERPEAFIQHRKL